MKKKMASWLETNLAYTVIAFSIITMFIADEGKKLFYLIYNDKGNSTGLRPSRSVLGWPDWNQVQQNSPSSRHDHICARQITRMPTSGTPRIGAHPVFLTCYKMVTHSNACRCKFIYTMMPFFLTSTNIKSPWNNEIHWYGQQSSSMIPFKSEKKCSSSQNSPLPITPDMWHVLSDCHLSNWY